MFTVTIKNVHDKSLGELISKIGTKKWSVRLTHNEDEETTKRAYDRSAKRTHMTADTVISLTGKKAAKGSMREKCLEAMELLEKKHGIGSVTRGMLREDLGAKNLDTQVLYQLVREGYLKKR